MAGLGQPEIRDRYLINQIQREIAVVVGAEHVLSLIHI